LLQISWEHSGFRGTAEARLMVSFFSIKRSFFYIEDLRLLLASVCSPFFLSWKTFFSAENSFPSKQKLVDLTVPPVSFYWRIQTVSVLCSM
jgi:hypothetical protein